MDRIRNEYVRGTSHVEQVGDKVRGARLGLVWSCAEEGCRICWEKDAEHGATGGGGGGAKQRFMDAVRDDMRVVGVTEEEAGDRARWRLMIRCGDP